MNLCIHFPCSSYLNMLPLLLLLLCYNRVDLQRVSPAYTIVAPSKLRPNIVYHVSITLHDALAPVDFTVQIHGFTEKLVPVNSLRNVHIEPKQTEIVDFQSDDWEPGNYTLEVVGRGGLSMHNSTSLQFVHKSYSVFIQTDRPVYKPGQLVQFRVIVVDPYLLPRPRPFPINLLLKDANANTIQEWRNVETTNGVASADWQLSDGPVLGDWSIHVDVQGQKFQKAFPVAEF